MLVNKVEPMWRTKANARSSLKSQASPGTREELLEHLLANIPNLRVAGVPGFSVQTISY